MKRMKDIVFPGILLLLLLGGCSHKGSKVFVNQLGPYAGELSFQKASYEEVSGWKEVLYEGMPIYINPEKVLTNRDVYSVTVSPRKQYQPPLWERIRSIFQEEQEEEVIPMGSRDVSQPSMYQMIIEFHAQGAEKFARLTGESFGESLAILLDGKVLLHATIMERIADGKCQVNGSFSYEELLQMAKAITGN